jgi:hypothetical protein
MSQYNDRDPAKRLADEKRSEMIFRPRADGQSNPDSFVDMSSSLADMECGDVEASQFDMLMAAGILILLCLQV